MNNNQIPAFEGYDKTPRWEKDGLFQYVAFEDGVTFGYVTFIPYEGWVSRCIRMADDGSDLIDSGFISAGQAMEYVNRVYLEWQELLSSLDLELAPYELEPFELPDIDEELLEAMEGMSLEEMAEFLGLLDGDGEI